MMRRASGARREEIGSVLQEVPSINRSWSLCQDPDCFHPPVFSSHRLNQVSLSFGFTGQKRKCPSWEQTRRRAIFRRNGKASGQSRTAGHLAFPEASLKKLQMTDLHRISRQAARNRLGTSCVAFLTGIVRHFFNASPHQAWPFLSGLEAPLPKAGIRERRIRRSSLQPRMPPRTASAKPMNSPKPRRPSMVPPVTRNAFGLAAVSYA
jgi:hypothetical protein